MQPFIYDIAFMIKEQLSKFSSYSLFHFLSWRN